MAALAVTCHSDAAIADQVIDVSLIKRLAEGIAVGRLVPFGVGACVAPGTTLGFDEFVLTNKLASGGLCVRRREGEGPKGISYPLGGMKRASVASTGRLKPQAAAMTHALKEIRNNPSLLTRVIVGVKSTSLGIDYDFFTVTFVPRSDIPEQK